MRNSLIRWGLVNREDLLDIFLGEIDIKSGHVSRFPHQDVKRGMLAIGFSDDTQHLEENNPTLLVIEDHLLSETMSWLRVFSGEMSPLSQFVRVILRSDLDIFDLCAEGAWKPNYHLSERWACIAVGESLALAEGDLDLRTMALSRISYTFSLPVGRTTLNYNNDKSTRTCTDRLRKIESDHRFGRRSLPIDQLTPIWALANSNIPGRMSAEEAVEIVLEFANKHFYRYSKDFPHSGTKWLEKFNGLKSNSAEERVMSFNRLSTEIINLYSDINIESYAPILAAAAWMVGRGTSHVFLLKRLGKIAPITCVWFGLIAALSGPRAWDGAWLRAAKGAERLLKYGFSWTEVSNADISWPEFSWLIDTFESSEQINSLPKMLPRTLAVEIAPGALVYLRLSGAILEQENRHIDEQNVKERDLQNALSQFMHLTDKFRNLIEPNTVESYTDRAKQKEQTQKSSEKPTRQSRAGKVPRTR